MIAGVAFLPHPPVLVPALARGAAAELDELRAACRAAIERVAADGNALVVLGAGPVTARHGATARGSLAGFGLPLDIPLGSDAPGRVELPLSLAIGAWLLREYVGPDNGAVGWSIGADGLPADWTPRGDPDEPVALLVMGDGSARRSTAAPGYLDPRAAAFDASVAAALRSGIPEALRLRDDTLLVGAGNTWWAAAEVLAGTTWQADLSYEDAPYGVGYFVATWSR